MFHQCSYRCNRDYLIEILSSNWNKLLFTMLPVQNIINLNVILFYRFKFDKLDGLIVDNEFKKKLQKFVNKL